MNHELINILCFYKQSVTRDQRPYDNKIQLNLLLLVQFDEIVKLCEVDSDRLTKYSEQKEGHQCTPFVTTLSKSMSNMTDILS